MSAERPWRCEQGALVLHLRLTPKGGRDSFDGFSCDSDGRPHALARVRAVPEDGAANAALIALLAKTFGVRKSAIELLSGQSARLKALRLPDADGAVQAALEQRWQQKTQG